MVDVAPHKESQAELTTGQTFYCNFSVSERRETYTNTDFPFLSLVSYGIWLKITKPKHEFFRELWQSILEKSCAAAVQLEKT
jgi:hypothetical protein